MENIKEKRSNVPIIFAHDFDLIVGEKVKYTV